MLEELKERVCAANKQLKESGLVILTWGNVSAIDKESNLMVIKPSGVSYDELTPDKMVVVNMDGVVVEGDLNPSSDTPSHIALYLSFPEIGGIVHTHSRYATVWAQAGLDIVAYGTTHADYFYGDVPCTMPLETSQIEEEYEKNTGYAIADTFARRRINCLDIPACLVAYHGPFTWGETPEKAVENAIVLEEVAHMAVFNSNFQFGLTRIQDALLDKHYLRKHGDNAYYGQINNTNANEAEGDGEDIQIAPSSATIELKNISEIASVERPVINKPPKKKDSFDFGDDPAPSGDDDMSGADDSMGGVEDMGDMGAADDMGDMGFADMAGDMDGDMGGMDIPVAAAMPAVAPAMPSVTPVTADDTFAMPAIEPVMPAVTAADIPAVEPVMPAVTAADIPAVEPVMPAVTAADIPAVEPVIPAAPATPAAPAVPAAADNTSGDDSGSGSGDAGGSSEPLDFTF